MGLHVGGIYVDASKKEITQESVADFIRQYWLKLGAKESKKDPLQFDSLSLAKTGLLGFAITTVEKDEAGQQWIGIYDSERYTADPALARALSIHFGIDVWFYNITDSVNQAYAKKYGKQEEIIKNYNKALEKAESFPYTLLYFNELKNLTEEELKNFVFLSFEDIPFRPKAQYSGPSPEQLNTNDILILAKQYAENKNADELIKLADNHSVYYDVIHNAFDYANLDDPNDLAFIYKLGLIGIQKKDAYYSIAEAALKMKDEKMFEEAIQAMADYRLYTLEQRALDIVGKGEAYIAFRLIEAYLNRIDYQDPRVLNNAAYILLRTTNNTGVSAERLEKLLKNCYEKGSVNPSILHNLACVYVNLKNYNMALQCVNDAVKYGYHLIDQLKNDTDLDPIKPNPRFKEAFEKKQNITSVEHLKISHTEKGKEIRWITPTIGLHLYFEKDAPQAPAAELLEELYKEFPEMFAYYQPSGHICLSPTKKGKVKRDVTMLRKGGAPYGYDIYYNALDNGAASDLRFLLELKDYRGGEISIHLPISLANDEQKLYERLIGYASNLPFTVGNAGYSFAVYYEGNGCPAMENLIRLLQSNLGFTTSQKSTHYPPKAQFAIPNWLTFLGPKMLEKINLKELPIESIKVLSNQGVVIQAAPKPFIGVATNPDDLGILPQIIKVLEPVLLKDSNKDSYSELIKVEIERLQKIKQLG